MSVRACPVSGQNRSTSGGTCQSGRLGPRGCAFAAFQPNLGTPTACSSVSKNDNDIKNSSDYLQTLDDASVLYENERKTLQDILMPEAPARQITNGLKNADNLNPTDDDILAAALGAPGRRVLVRAEEIGPRTGWKDG